MEAKMSEDTAKYTIFVQHPCCNQVLVESTTGWDLHSGCDASIIASYTSLVDAIKDQLARGNRVTDRCCMFVFNEHPASEWENLTEHELYDYMRAHGAMD
jgi:DNA-binding Lrp family transcriptional regulator